MGDEGASSGRPDGVEFCLETQIFLASAAPPDLTRWRCASSTRPRASPIDINRYPWLPRLLDGIVTYITILKGTSKILPFTFSCSIEQIDTEKLSDKYKRQNCAFLRAMTHQAGNGSAIRCHRARGRYENECNVIGWALTHINESLRNRQRKMLAVVVAFRRVRTLLVGKNSSPFLGSRVSNILHSSVEDGFWRDDVFTLAGDENDRRDGNPEWLEEYFGPLLAY
ncbi:hypothetical protein ANO11243_097370 [Dothideomycetidae sp. 11243]|nr:hypothetical protein ANO11243_097370 [fungal sp. No.11243]